MSMETSTHSPYVSELARRFQEPDWLVKQREEAFASFSTMPSPKLEKTDLRNRPWNLEAIPSATTGEAGRAARALLEGAKNVGSACIYVRDGVLIEAIIPEALSAQGVYLADLHAAVKAQEELVRRYLYSVVRPNESKWAALNAALWHGGLFLHVPRGVTVDTPVHFIYEETAAGRGALPRVLLVLEDEAAVTFSEAYVCAEDRDTGLIHSSVTEVVAGAGAKAVVASLSRYSKGPTNFFTRRALLAKDASVDWVVGDVSDGFTVGLVESRLEGPGSRSTTRGFGLGYGRQRLDFTASMEHVGHHSESDITLFGVMRGRANSTYRSSTHICRGANEASSEQHDRMLMLGSRARAEAIPMLLIDENDVQRCGHAASVGRIDENQVYYLMARGIPKAEAERMIIWGYLHPLVDAVPSEPWRAEVASWIDGELTL
ncbi:MAG: SufD family Fe-S cluster assembly protein [Alicyclobacillus herbarius]|uniref:SufB/SufD family protein n=1 Tax=Alicyclobacillus herbarius TaxID=122960 RepID=UPI0023521554|nr:SufD family Fe-S cluster assembly protein [Alicyclobacillus herbarius]MCL6632404.1 SufD family Fe-S cluster assembly protein [Alicyclobacillus herbarius]